MSPLPSSPPLLPVPAPGGRCGLEDQTELLGVTATRAVCFHDTGTVVFFSASSLQALFPPSYLIPPCYSVLASAIQ
ncbi:hypothetical protein PAMP_006089 [Pampus punctatissimus]